MNVSFTGDVENDVSLTEKDTQVYFCESIKEYFSKDLNRLDLTEGLGS